MQQPLDGRVALVTGGSKGIGRAIAAAFVANGARVMVVARDRVALEETAAALGPDAAIFSGDITEAAVADAAVAEAIERFGQLDVLVNNAAVYLDHAPLLDMEDEDLEHTWRTNLHAPIIWSRVAWRRWMAGHGGAIINMSSNTSFQYTFGGVYVLAKVALNHLTRQLAIELAPSVRVNCIAPGLIRTELSAEMFDGPRPPRVPPLGRHGQVDDCVGAALYFATDVSSWVTGQVLTVDGGSMIYDYDRGPKMPKPAGGAG